LNKPHGFNEDDLQLIEVLSDQVSFVIQNMLLFSSERRRNEELSVLNDISIAAADAQNEDELIEFVTQLIGEKLFPDNFGVMMLDDTGELLVLHSSYRLGNYEIPASVPVSQGVSGYVARTGKVRREKDIRKVDDYLTVDTQTLSELCNPIKVGDKVIGVFNTESTRLNAFSKRDEDLMRIITSQLSIVIERLRSDVAQKKQTSALSRSNALIKVLAQVSSKASKAVVPDGVMQTLGDELAALGLFCVIALPRAENRKMHIVFTSIPERIVRVIERAGRKQLGEYSFSLDHIWHQPLRSMEPILLSDPANVISKYLVEVSSDAIQRILAPTGVSSSMPICQIPLVLEGTIQGFIWLWGEDVQASDIPAMSIFGSQVAISLQNAHLMEEVHKMAVTDDLTGIFNRRYFFELAEREFNQARRYELPLSAMIIDIDHFKKVNDTYGHIVGDQVLRNTTNILRKNLRDQDTLGRYGGEEFSVIMPVTDEKAAHQIALRLRNKVSESRVDTDAGPVSVKISLGISQLNKDMPTLLSLIHQADKAMYIAKSTGGNSVGRI
jgi:diguanylate cyclase (GGDEF)-like protein